ncbi:MAG: type II secretion system protein [Synergistaceae bacterium]|nr:type II secretion system protein [Synergistaceae bacterium]
MGNKHKAFTMTEILTAVVVMMMTLAVALMSPRGVRQTAKREAERLQAYIYRNMQKADRIHKNFYLTFYTDFVRLNWHDQSTIDDSFKISEGCSYTNTFTDSEAHYNAGRRRFTNAGTITVNGADGKIYYVIIAGITEGRVRISETP